MSVSVKSNVAQVLKEMGDNRKGVNRAIAAALNRTAATVASRTTRKVTEVFNVGLRDIRPYITTRNATASMSAMRASILFRIRAVSPNVFKPKVKMERVLITRKDGTTYSRKLPVVYLKRYRGGKFKKMPGVFPMHTRTSGTLPPNDKLVRRIGSRRDRLTQLRFYIMPPSFVFNVLMPTAKATVGERFTIEFRSAYRKFVGGRDRLVP